MVLRKFRCKECTTEIVYKRYTAYPAAIVIGISALYIILLTGKVPHKVSHIHIADLIFEEEPVVVPCSDLILEGISARLALVVLLHHLSGHLGLSRIELLHYLIGLAVYQTGARCEPYPVSLFFAFLLPESQTWKQHTCFILKNVIILFATKHIFVFAPVPFFACLFSTLYVLACSGIVRAI